MVVKISADYRRNNLSTVDKVSVFIPEPVNIQNTQFIVWDEYCTDKTIVFNFKKINFCDSQYILLHYVFVFPTYIQSWNYKNMLETSENI